jgi:hypothetical protein
MLATISFLALRPTAAYHNGRVLEPLKLTLFLLKACPAVPGGSVCSSRGPRGQQLQPFCLIPPTPFRPYLLADRFPCYGSLAQHLCHSHINVWLRSTLANVYYKSFALTRNLQDPSKVFGYDNSDAMATCKGFAEVSAEVLASYQIAKGLVRALREVRKERSDLYEYLVVLTLDLLNYRIPNADQKTPIQRSIERKLRKPPSEIDGLYDRMEPGRKLGVGKPKPGTCVPVESKLPFPRGSRVEHPKFGLDSVLFSTEEQIVINFDQFGVKMFVVCFVLPDLKQSDRDAETMPAVQQSVLRLALALIKVSRPSHRGLIVAQKRTSLADERLTELERNANSTRNRGLPQQPTRPAPHRFCSSALVLLPDLPRRGLHRSHIFIRLPEPILALLADQQVLFQAL